MKDRRRGGGVSPPSLSEVRGQEWDGCIFLADDAAGARGLQPHKWLVRIDPIMNHLRRCLPVCRPVHFVLHRGENLLRHLRVRRLVHTRRVNIEHFLFGKK